jgi:hypothetical protein
MYPLLKDKAISVTLWYVSFPRVTSKSPKSLNFSQKMWFSTLLNTFLHKMELGRAFEKLQKAALFPIQLCSNSISKKDPNQLMIKSLY